MNVHTRIATEAPSWAERNQRWLVARIARLRERIERLQAGDAAATDLVEADADAEVDFGPALERCAELFGLSRFERDVLLLCAGAALDADLARVVAAVGGHADGAPTFSLAMSLPGEPHWDAMSPQAPLRYWRLLSLDGGNPSRAAMRIDERVLHYLTGVAAIDERLDGMLEIVSAPPAVAPPDWVAQAVAALASGTNCVQLHRPGAAPTREQILPLLAATGHAALWLRDLPDDPLALARTLRLVDREAALSQALVVLDARDGIPAALPAQVQARLRSALVVVGGEPASAPDLRLRRIALPAWTPAEQAAELVQRSRRLGATPDEVDLHAAFAEACEQFALSDPRALDEVATLVAGAGPDPRCAAEQAWRALREHSRDGLDALAQRIDSGTTLDDLVLPDAQLAMLRDIGRQLRHRRRVYRDWGFAARSSRGLGLAALFAGESGTGKTMAAEAIANAAGLDLYRVDLASTVSKYIGETEKNLKRIFDAAEASGAVLLFDEADALFGKRSEVKDSHDRYANIETAYLLQRIEAYRGLAILTTNMKNALDKAFLRRIRFVVQFPFPDEAARVELWRRQFPAQAPLDPEIRWEPLARLQLAGGHIRGIALNAAFMAAHEDAAISQRHLTAAAHAELAKLERSPGTQTGGRG
ncbi:ATP-binding protein [Pseudoxanthomonas sangjuensis]|uniref:AAA family ATPase n=1 Tax=Pseudoxanthomonas sangjuensis TaxID=1503750 RepID=UPI001391D148|nr:ATP-binding protein [Pseudoxanthomonas sangjuensis]KAF1709699.1 AAA family ATPase [Pseudoxanthomonas sangjuensis]